MARVQRVVHNKYLKYFYYRVAGLGEFLAALVGEPDESKRTEMANEMLATLYPTVSAQLLIRVQEPIKEIIGNK